MGKLDQQVAIEDFVNKLYTDTEEVKRLISFLNIEDDKQKQLLNESIRIITRKIKKLKQCETIKDTKKYIKKDKVVRDYG